MTPEQFENYKKHDEPDDLITADMFRREEHLLCRGYNMDRQTTETRIASNVDGDWCIQHTINGTQVILNQSVPAKWLVPTKRAYIEHTDYEFAVAMLHLGHQLTFTKYGASGKEAEA